MHVRHAAHHDVSGLKGVPLPVILSTKRIALGPGGRGARGFGWRSGALLAAVAVGFLSAGSPSPAVAADTCVNATVRAQSGSSGLPDCRAYEMVSPPYKEGFPVYTGLTSFTDDGIVSYRSYGNFAGNTQSAINLYHATRSTAGWMTTALSPPDVIYNTGGNPADESGDLRSSLWKMSRRDLPGAKIGYYVRSLDGAFTRIGDAEDDVYGTRVKLGASVDFSHIVFNYGPQDGALYETVDTGNGGSVRAVSVDNQGQPTADACANSVSGDGRVIVYTAGCRGLSQVWARVAGSASVAVSGSECTRSSGDPGGACNGVSAAQYGGGAADGSRVFFTTSQQLVNADIDATNDLYACDVPAGAPMPVGSANPCASLTEVSGTAANAQVENVVAVSEDGSRAYFVAQGVLANNLGVGDVGPATGPGAHNLYLWQRDAAHPSGETRFVAGLTGPAGNDLQRPQMTPDGRYLLFLTANQMVSGGPDADTDGAVDAYRYDAVAKTMVRVSTSVSGSGGNGLGFDVSTVVGASSMTADGSTVIFDTDEALAPSDTDGVTDVYAWHNGQVSLISAGGGESVGITASGRDIFFITGVPMLAADGDLNRDIYDARVGGGFALAAQATPCSVDECHGQRGQVPRLVGPSAAVSGGLGAIDVPLTFSLRAVSAAQRKALAATGKVSLVVTANAPGTISIRAMATIGGRSVTVGSARRTLSTAPGKVSVTLTLSKKARSQLAARGRLTVKIAVSHSKVALDRMASLRLVHVRPKAKRLAKRAQMRRAVVSVERGRS